MHAVRFYTTLSSTAVGQFLLIKNNDDDDGLIISYQVSLASLQGC